MLISLEICDLCRLANGELSRGDDDKAGWGGVWSSVIEPCLLAKGRWRWMPRVGRNYVQGGGLAAFLKRICREHLEPNLRVGPVIVGGCKVKTRGTNDRGRGISMSV